MHTLVSALFFIVSGIGLIVIGNELRGAKTGYIAIVAGIAPFIFVLTGMPLVEHIAVLGIVLAEVALSVRMLQKAS